MKVLLDIIAVLIVIGSIFAIFFSLYMRGGLEDILIFLLAIILVVIAVWACYRVLQIFED